MKLHRLELTGFGPFRARQQVDFDAFDRDGLFLISGRTGAGKSSILDGVCFALFGSVPRFGSGDRRLRSDHCAPTDPTEVRLEFTVGDVRWRVTRAPEYERPAKRGGGVTSAPARAELEERVAGDWVGRAKGPRDVGHALHEVLGLSVDQFQQVILLAQNQFSRFLLAGVKERQELLRTLFGTRRFERYRDDLRERSKYAQRQVADAQTRAATVLEMAERLIHEHGLDGADQRSDGQRDDEPGQLPEGVSGEAVSAGPSGPGGAGSRDVANGSGDLATRLAHAGRALQRAQYRVEALTIARAQANEASTRAAEALQRARADAATLDELAGVRVRLEALDADEPHIDLDRQRLQRARAADALHAPIHAAERAERELTDARETESVARAEWLRVGGGPDDDVAAIVEELTGELARWRAAEQHERELSDAAGALAALVEAKAARDERVAHLDVRLAAMPAAVERLDAALVAARERAGRAGDLLVQRDQATERLTAARETASHAVEVVRLDAEAAERHADAAHAGEVVAELMRRRFAGFAGELAARLTDGEPCEVCGSTSHPAPATASDEPVTDDDIERAQRGRDTAERVARQAAIRASDERAALAEATGRSGGLTVEAAEAELTVIDTALADAQAAATEADRVTAERAEQEADAERCRHERTALAAEVAADREEIARLEALSARLRAEVDEARGPFDTVAARLADATARRDAGRALRDADARRQEGERAHERAVVDRDERIAASVFDDVDSAVAARLDAAACTALDERIAAHAADRSAAKARALELELAVVEIDAAAVDVAAAADAASAADDAHAAAIEAERDATTAEERLRGLLAQLDDEHAATQALADEAAVVTRLADTIAGRAPNTLGMDLETFVLAAELEEIVRAANLRLSEMSAGRYTLHHTDARVSRGASGLGIEVLDAHTGRLRSPQSLSGGETFLASLSLALGLADVVTSRAGGLRLDTLFVDEGFGSLDPETLELAMRTLDELRAGGRTVGLISHVEAMKEQIPAQLVVTATPEGPSTITPR